MFTVVVLDYMMKINDELWNYNSLKKRMKRLRNEIEDGIKRYGIIRHETYGLIYAYEVDGFGNYFLMDDANVSPKSTLYSLPGIQIRQTNISEYKAIRLFDRQSIIP